MIDSLFSYARLVLALVARGMQLLVSLGRLYVKTAFELSQQLSIWLSLTLATVKMIAGMSLDDGTVQELST